MDKIYLRENLYNLWTQLVTLEGWEILEDQKLLCLKSPTQDPTLNICWGINSQQTLEIAREFFEGKPFGFIEEDIDPFLSPAFSLASEVRIKEMLLINPEIFEESSHSIAEIHTVTTQEDKERWASLSQEIFNRAPEDALTFISAVSPLPHAYFFIAYQAQTPVGIGHIYIDSTGIACISSVGVLKDYQRQGVGTVILKTCVNTSLKAKACYIGLYASEMGMKLYESLNFSLMRTSRLVILSSESFVQ